MGHVVAFPPHPILAARPLALAVFLFMPASSGSTVSREIFQNILGSHPILKKKDCIDLYFYLSRLGFDERGEGL